MTETYPLQLRGIVLSYSNGGNPTYRTFRTMSDLERFVGRFLMTHHRSDEHWIDAVMESGVTVIDESITIEYDEEEKVEPKTPEHHGCEYGCTEHCVK